MVTITKVSLVLDYSLLDNIMKCMVVVVMFAAVLQARYVIVKTKQGRYLVQYVKKNKTEEDPVVAGVGFYFLFRAAAILRLKNEIYTKLILAFLCGGQIPHLERL